jgi:subtilisin family serine protease
MWSTRNKLSYCTTFPYNFYLLVSILVFVQVNLLSAQTKQDNSPKWIAGEVLVKFSNLPQDVTKNFSADEVIKKSLGNDFLSITSIFDNNPNNKAAFDKIDNSNWYNVKLSKASDSDMATACSKLTENNPNIFCQPNYIYHTQAWPNDELVSGGSTVDGTFSKCAWGQGEEDLWGLKSIKAIEAWHLASCPSAGCRGQGVVAAVLDTGIDPTHPDIQANLWINSFEDINKNGIFDNTPASTGGDIDGIDQDSNGYFDDVIGANLIKPTTLPIDDNGHGTHVSGTIAAQTDNTIGIAGVAPMAKIMALRGLNKTGSGSTDKLALGFKYIVTTLDFNKDGRVDVPVVMNNSWGGGGVDPLLEEAVKNAVKAGVVIVFAAGNSDADMSLSSPANLSEVISVASIARNNYKSSFSNFGHRVSVAAPGGGGSLAGTSCSNTTTPSSADSNILSLLANNSLLQQERPKLIVKNRYIRLAGTSMAAPHVTGVAALLLSQRPTLNPAQVKTLLQVGSDPYQSYYKQSFIGNGIVNAVKVLSLPTIEPIIVDLIDPSKAFYSTNNKISIGGKIYANSYNIKLLQVTEGSDWIDPINSSDIFSGTGNALGEITSFDAKNLDDTFSYWLELTGTRDGYSITSKRYLRFDSKLKPGWPAQLGSSDLGGGFGLTQTSVLSDDLDQDGELEIIHLSPNGFFASSDLYILNSKGNVLSITQSAIPTSAHTTLSADLDGEDGVKEIVVADPNGIFSFNSDGSKRFAVRGTPFNTVRSVSAADIDNNGTLEVIETSVNNSDLNNPITLLYAYDSNGTPLANWKNGIQVDSSAISGGPVAIGDINNDGNNEIIITGLSDCNVKVFRGDGSPYQPFNFSRPCTRLPYANYSTLGPVIGDIDGIPSNGKEIAFTLDELMYVIHSDGSIVNGWPKEFNIEEYWLPLNGISDRPALADIDGDGKLEIFVNSFRSQTIEAWHHDGSKVNFSQSNLTYPGLTSHSTIFGDVDGDSKPEIIAQDLYSTSLIALSNLGEIIPGWKRTLENANYLTGAAAIKDIDGDGKNDIIKVDASGYIYAWSTVGNSCQGNPWPEYAADSQRTGSFGINNLSHRGAGCGLTINGQVLLNSQPLKGVVAIDGTLGKRRSNDQGVFRFVGLQNGTSYSIKPLHPGYTFSPESYSGTINTNTSIVFNAATKFFPLTGGITDPKGNPLSGITVSDASIGQTQTDSFGKFSFPSLQYRQKYTLQFTKSNYTFTPKEISGTVTDSNPTISVIATPINIKLSGKVVYNKKPLSGVVISVPGVGKFKSKRNGKFTIKNLEYNKSYRIKFKKSGYKFKVLKLTLSGSKSLTIKAK